MSVDLIQLGEDIGEAKAEADAALEVAEVAAAMAVVAAVEGEGSEDEEHACCEHCTEAIAELRGMLVALSDKYDEDMDLISRVLDELLEVPEEAEEGETDEEPVEIIHPEEAETPEEEKKADDTGTESTGREQGAEGDHGAGSSSEREAAAEAKPPHAEHRTKQRPSTSRRIRFARGRR